MSKRLTSYLAIITCLTLGFLLGVMYRDLTSCSTIEYVEIPKSHSTIPIVNRGNTILSHQLQAVYKDSTYKINPIGVTDSTISLFYSIPDSSCYFKSMVCKFMDDDSTIFIAGRIFYNDSISEKSFTLKTQFAPGMNEFNCLIKDLKEI